MSCLSKIFYSDVIVIVILGSKGPDTQGQPPAMVAGLPVGSGVNPQPAFCFHNVWLPLLVNLSAPSSSNKLSL